MILKFYIKITNYCTNNGKKERKKFYVLKTKVAYVKIELPPLDYLPRIKVFLQVFWMDTLSFKFSRVRRPIDLIHTS